MVSLRSLNFTIAKQHTADTRAFVVASIEAYQLFLRGAPLRGLAEAHLASIERRLSLDSFATWRGRAQ